MFDTSIVLLKSTLQHISRTLRCRGETYSHSNINQRICAYNTMTNARVGIALAYVVDGSVDQKWLSKGEPSQAQPWDDGCYKWTSKRMEASFEQAVLLFLIIFRPCKIKLLAEEVVIEFWIKRRKFIDRENPRVSLTES